MYNQPAAVRSVLDPRYLHYCLNEPYDLGAWEECVYWLNGLNDTYRVRTTSGVYILRVYRREVQESDAAYELSLLNELREYLGSSPGTTQVAEPLARKDRSWYTLIPAPEGSRIAVLFPFIEGTENPLQDEASCYAFGRSAAELHAAMDRSAPKQPRHELNSHFLIDLPLERVVNHVGERHGAVPFLQQFAGALQERVTAAAEQGLEWGICHGDMHGNNNAIETEGGFTHFDFEWAAPGWRAYDLAQVRGRKRQREEQRDVLWDALMRGYRSVRSFSARDEAAIELFMIVRRWWVMGLDALFIPSTMGALDYGEDWLNGFLEEFRSTGFVSSGET